MQTVSQRQAAREKTWASAGVKNRLAAIEEKMWSSGWVGVVSKLLDVKSLGTGWVEGNLLVSKRDLRESRQGESLVKNFQNAEFVVRKTQNTQKYLQP